MHENINHFKVIGVSHHLANVELREQFSLNEDEITIIHQHLGNYTRGGFVLSTCNRTEIYFVATDASSLKSSWADLVGIEANLLSQYLYEYEGKKAIEYLFRVGTGLDSQILGDFQIIGQIKKAYQKAIQDGAQNGKITRLIDQLLKTSKRVKNETNLSSGVASMAYASIQYLQHHLQDFSQKSGLVYGAGKMGTAVVRNLSELLPSNQIVLANRTEQRAKQVAEKYQVNHSSSQDLAQLVRSVDFLISTATVEQTIFTPSLLQSVDLSGKCFIDLSMPRSIDPKLSEQQGVTIINLDDLIDVQNETFELRKESIPQAESIVEEELNEFFQWIKEHDIRPTVHAIKEKLNGIKQAEIKKLLKEDSSLSADQVSRIADAIINKVTSQCVKHVKKHNGSSIDLISELFELDESK